MASLVCLGEIIVEMVAETVGQSPLEPGNWIGPYPSGAPAILADQAALCGANASIIGTVGDDDFGRVCIRKLEADGVSTRLVRTSAERPTGVAFVRYRSDGSRKFIFHVASAASGELEPNLVPDNLAGVDCLHVMGSSAFSVEAVRALVQAVQVATELGMRVSFDPNIRAEMLRDPEFAQALKWVLSRADIVLASEGELLLLTDEASDDSAARTLLNGKAEVVVLKKGARGSEMYFGEGQTYKCAPVVVEEVDPTGAGDCFGGTFLALYLGGWDPRQALELANIAGALSVTERGPMSGNRSLDELLAARSELGHMHDDVAASDV